MSECVHASTRVQGDGQGVYCYECGANLYKFESRECQYCANFREDLAGATCEAKNQEIFRTMHALYETETGTCFRIEML